MIIFTPSVKHLHPFTYKLSTMVSIYIYYRKPITTELILEKTEEKAILLTYTIYIQTKANKNLQVPKVQRQHESESMHFYFFFTMKPLSVYMAILNLLNNRIVMSWSLGFFFFVFYTF